MGFFRLEHSKLAYGADFALYGLAVLVIAFLLVLNSPQMKFLEIIIFSIVGIVGWSGMEYALHRFVLHGVEPFRRWHAAHHERPIALICAPTMFSASLIFSLIFLPTLFISSLWHAAALTFGVLLGYLIYATTHHATHHWRAKNTWSKNRKHWHALHHHRQHRGFYGVTTTFWDHVFGTDVALVEIQNL